MELRETFEWRGLGSIAGSALRPRAEFADWDAERRYELPGVRVADPKACQCGEVLIGAIKPWECRVFGTACTPEQPDRNLHGLERGRLRRVLRVRAWRGRARSRARVRPRRAEAPRRRRHAGPRCGRKGDSGARRGTVRDRSSPTRPSSSSRDAGRRRGGRRHGSR